MGLYPADEPSKENYVPGSSEGFVLTLESEFSGTVPLLRHLHRFICLDLLFFYLFRSQNMFL